LVDEEEVCEIYDTDIEVVMREKMPHLSFFFCLGLLEKRGFLLDFLV
jgi:hypothetical protein